MSKKIHEGATWKTQRLGDICDFSSGLWKGKKPPFKSVGVIRNTNFNADGTLNDADIAYLDVEERQLAKRTLQFGDIVLEKSGGGPKQPVGRVIFFDKLVGEYSFSNFTACIRSKNPQVLYPHLHRYLYWIYAAGLTESMQSHSTGIRNLNLNSYKDLQLSYPSLQEQKRIISTLDEAIEGLTSVRENVQNSLANGRKLFQSKLQSLLGTSINSSLTNLGEQTDISTGFPFNNDRYTESTESIRLLRGDNIIQGQLRWEDVKKWPIADSEEYKDYELREGDVVLAMDRTWVKAGIKYAVLSSNDVPCLLVQRTARMRAKKTLNPSFLRWIISSNRFTEYVLSVQTGSGVPHISGSQIKAFTFQLPPMNDHVLLLAFSMSFWQKRIVWRVSTHRNYPH